MTGLVRSVRTPEFEGVTFHEVLAKSALNHVSPTSRMLPGEWTLNPYRGCTHACAYCYARPTHDHLGLGIGSDFERQVVVKTNIVDVLRTELATRRTLPDRVALGTNTDPYQRAEGRYRLMPGIIDALADARVPFSILTKGTLVRRDVERLAAASTAVHVELGLSISILDDALQASLEPGTPSTSARLATLRELRSAGTALHRVPRADPAVPHRQRGAGRRDGRAPSRPPAPPRSCPRRSTCAAASSRCSSRGCAASTPSCCPATPSSTPAGPTRRTPTARR